MVSSAFHSTEAEDDPLLYKLGSRLFARERVELLIELFWEVLEKKTFGINAPPTGKPLFSEQSYLVST